MKRPAFANIGRPFRIAFLIVAVGSALAVGGCGDEATPGPASGGDGPVGSNPVESDPVDEPVAVTDNPCELLSREEAAAIAGNPVTEGKRLGVLCIWEPEDVTDSAQVQVSVGYLPIPPGSDPDAICASGLPGIPNAEPFTGADLGNSVYWDYRSAAMGNAGNLHVCADNAIIDTQAIGGRSEAELQQMAVSMATTVLGRI